MCVWLLPLLLVTCSCYRERDAVMYTLPRLALASVMVKVAIFRLSATLGKLLYLAT